MTQQLRQLPHNKGSCECSPGPRRQAHKRDPRKYTLAHTPRQKAKPSSREKNRGRGSETALWRTHASPPGRAKPLEFRNDAEMAVDLGNVPTRPGPPVGSKDEQCTPMRHHTRTKHLALECGKGLALCIQRVFKELEHILWQACARKSVGIRGHGRDTNRDTNRARGGTQAGTPTRPCMGHRWMKQGHPPGHRRHKREGARPREQTPPCASKASDSPSPELNKRALSDSAASESFRPGRGVAMAPSSARKRSRSSARRLASRDAWRSKASKRLR